MAGLGLVSLAACGSGDETGQTGDSTLTVAISADARSLWPNNYTAQNEINISEQITEKLIEFSPDATSFEPRLATKWKQINPTTVRLTLRPDVSFTNGEPFNAKSAKKSIDIMLAAPTYKAYTKAVAGAKVVDDHTLDVYSKQPSGMVLMALAMGSFQYPPANWDKVGEKGVGTAPVGTGPYTLDKWTKGVGVSLKANPDYWGGKPKSDSLKFQVIADPAAQVAALQSGQVDMVSDVPIGSYESLKKDPAVAVVTRPSNRVYYVGMSSLRGSSLVKPEVRRALAYAIDVKSLIANQLGGHGTPLKGQLVPPNYLGFDSSLAPTPYDPAKAKEMLAKAGASHLKIRLNYPSGRYPQDKEIGEAIASQLGKVGVTVNQRVLEPGTFLSELVAEKLGDAFFAGLLLPPDAHLIYEQFASEAPFHYNAVNPKIDSLMAKDAKTADTAERKRYLNEITGLLAQDPPFVPLFQGEDIYATSKDVKGFKPRASQFVDFASISAG